MSTEETKLEEYVLGLLDESTCQTLERELAASDDKQRELHRLQESLDLLAEAEPLVMLPSVNLRQCILDTVAPKTRFDGYIDRCMELFDLSKTRMLDVLASIDKLADDGDWSKTPIPGTHVLYFDGGSRVATASCGLVHIKAGRVFPAHRHAGCEWSLILQGSACEDSGRLIQPGDLLFFEPGSSHAFRVFSGEDLIFAVVLEKPNKWLLVRTVFDVLLAKWRFKQR